MTSSIDPLRRSQVARRTRRSDNSPSDDPQASETSNLPVPVGRAQSVPRGGPLPGGDAAFNAQMLGERRGLRAGPMIHDEARSSYNRTEYSGGRDRRAPKGGAAKTQV